MLLKIKKLEGFLIYLSNRKVKSMAALEIKFPGWGVILARERERSKMIPVSWFR